MIPGPGNTVMEKLYTYGPYDNSSLIRVCGGVGRHNGNAMVDHQLVGQYACLRIPHCRTACLDFPHSKSCIPTSVVGACVHSCALWKMRGLLGAISSSQKDAVQQGAHSIGVTPSQLPL